MNVGRYTGTIEENDIRSAGSGTEFIYIRVEIEDGPERASMPIQIWLTEKAMGMARAQLRQCGFDVDKDPLASLSESNTLLQGRKVPVELYEEEWKGRMQMKAKIVTAGVSKKRIGALEKMLRDKGGDEPVSAVAAEEPVDDIPF